MDRLIEKLDRLLKASFRGSEVQLEEEPPRKVGGLLIWDGFEGKEQIDRQRKIWKVLREKLPATEQVRITAILSVTPDELSVMREG